MGEKEYGRKQRQPALLGLYRDGAMSQVMDAILAVRGLEPGAGRVGRAGVLEEHLWRMRGKPQHARLALGRAESIRAVEAFAGQPDEAELLGAVIGNVDLDLPAERWQRLLSRGDLGSELGHFCPDRDVLRALAGDHFEACANYACALAGHSGWSAGELEEFLQSSTAQRYGKYLWLALRAARPSSEEKAKVVRRYVALGEAELAQRNAAKRKATEMAPPGSPSAPEGG